MATLTLDRDTRRARNAVLRTRLAGTPREVEAAQRLRYEVFNIDEGLGLAASHANGIDKDEFDAHCEHLLVVDETAGAVVGTYRMLSCDRVPSFGWYSETEFDLSRVKASGLRLLEVGRSCVAAGQRDGRIIDLLFRGLGDYVRAHRIEALMGCVSVHGRDVETLRQIYHWLARHGRLVDERLEVAPLPTHAVDGVEDPPVDPDDEIAQKLPPLFRAYLQLGARIGGLPAYDAAFGTTDFFVLLELARIAPAYARRFLHCVA